MEHSISKIKTFIAVVESGSIKSAAEQLEVDPSTVSRQLSSLECDLGVLLVRRSNRRLNVTPIGRHIFKHYKRSIDELTKVENILTKPDTIQEIRISMPMIFGHYAVMKLVQNYISDNPNIRIHVDDSDEKRDVIKDNIDICIRGGYLKNDNVVAHAIAELKLSFIVSPSLLRRYPKIKCFSELTLFPWVKLSQYNRNTLPKFAEGYCLNAEKISNIPLWVNSQKSAIEAVVNGLGIAIVERIAIKDLIERRELIELFPDAILPIGHYWLYKPDGRRIMPHVREFSDYLLDGLRTSQITTQCIEQCLVT